MIVTQTVWCYNCYVVVTHHTLWIWRERKKWQECVCQGLFTFQVWVINPSCKLVRQDTQVWYGPRIIALRLGLGPVLVRILRCYECCDNRHAICQSKGSIYQLKYCSSTTEIHYLKHLVNLSYIWLHVKGCFIQHLRYFKSGRVAVWTGCFPRDLTHSLTTLFSVLQADSSEQASHIWGMLWIQTTATLWFWVCQIYEAGVVN